MYPIGTIRVWKDKKYKKVSYGKWQEVTGKKTRKMPLLIDHIDKILNGTQEERARLRQRFFKVADTGKILKNAGLVGDIITVKYGVIARHKNKDTDHKFKTKQWQQICQKINTPCAVTKYKDGYNVYLKAIKKGKPMLIGMSMKQDGKHSQVNTITTIFAKDLKENADIVYIKKSIIEGGISDRDQSPNIPTPNYASIIDKDTQKSIQKSFNFVYEPDVIYCYS